MLSIEVENETRDNMAEAFEEITSYCTRINQYLKGEGPKPANLPQSRLDAVKESCVDDSGHSKVQKSKLLQELKASVDETKNALEQKIQSLTESSNDQDKLITLYVFNRDMYRLHYHLHADDRDKIKDSLQQAMSAIPKLMKQADKRFQNEEWSLNLQDLAARFLRVFAIVSSCASFLLSFHYPEYVTILIPYPLICFIFVVPGLNFWLSSIEEKFEAARMRADPTSANQAMTFLKKPDADTHLWALFDDPSLEGDYQQQYISMLVDLGASCEWIDTKKDHVEAEKDTMKQALDESYAINPVTFDPEFLKSWRKTFEELQSEVREQFGSSIDLFHKKTLKDPAYFLECFRAFITSETGRKVKRFLHEL